LKAIPKLIDDFSADFLNYKESLYNKSMGLSEIQMANMGRSAVRQFEVQDEEVDRIREFF